MAMRAGVMYGTLRRGSRLVGFRRGGASTLLTDLYSYWKLDETSDGSTAVTRNDAHTGARHLTDNGTCPSAAGKLGNAISLLEANNEYLSLGSSLTLPVADWTVSAWVNPTTLTGAVGYGRGVLSNHSSNSAGDFYLGVTATGAVVLAHNTINGTDATGRKFTDFGAVATGSWHHVIWRRTSGTYTVRVNGAGAPITSDATFESGWGTLNFRVGQTWSDTGYRWEGLIDAVGIWTRALSDTECNSLRGGGSGLEYPF